MLEAQQEAAIDGILFVDENQNILSYNQHFVELWRIPESGIETRDEQQFLTSMIGQLTNSPKFVNEVENLYHDVKKSVRDEIDLGDGRTFERYCAPVNSAEREYFGRVWYFRDITERKQAEAKLRQQTQELENALQKLQNAQVQLIQSEKMSSLGQMVAGIAHEINNPVNFVDGNLTYAKEYSQTLLKLIEIYQQQYPDFTEKIQQEVDFEEIDFIKEDFIKIIQSMKVGTERIQEIVKSLRIFSRLDEAEIKHVDIHQGIDSTLMILQSRLKAQSNHPNIEVIKEYGELPLIDCYPGQLNQVFMNIISNAIDALEEQIGNRGWITENNHKDIYTACQIRIRTEVVNEKWVSISIADNGLGMTEEVSSKLFDPFFTTKEVGKGTGLGLSISHQIIVEKHGGKIICNSAPGKGTEFIIMLPIDLLHE